LTRTPRAHRLLVAAAATVAVVGLAACGSSSSSGSGTSAASGASAGTSSSTATGGKAVTLRLGYFPNLTHAVAIAGIQKGIYAKDLGTNVTLKTATFNAGPEAVQALFSGAIDASFVGPNPTINAWAKSKGKAIKVIAGAASGGAYLVVKPGITSAADLKGKKIATPQLGNTQDVALRYWLKQQGLKADQQGGGDVSIVPEDNGLTLTSFASGQIDGAWVPEPYASRLQLESGGKVLVDEKDLWPQGAYVTTDLVVTTKFLDAHPDVVKALLQGEVDTVAYLQKSPDEAQAAVNDGIKAISGKALDPKVLAAAWSHVTFTVDPVASSLVLGAQHAEAVGLLDKVNLDGLYDLDPLNAVLTAAGQPTVRGVQ
jgi:NitT/TauT family transport system substrate-binding protein